MTTAARELHSSPFALETYDYDLPPGLIAQAPLVDREAAQLLCLDRASGGTSHRHVRDLPERLRPGDVLVVNDTRVMLARLHGTTATGAKVEVLLVREVAPGLWSCLARPGKRFRVGGEVLFPGSVRAAVVEVGDGRVLLAFEAAVVVAELLDRHGETPLPPYIRRPEGPAVADRERYQTVYARAPGAVAAPTAGLHFTPALLERLRQHGVETLALTLHVGPGTFLPVRDADIRRHRMEPEWVDVPLSTVDAVAAAKREGRRVIAVGTTTTRALESRARENGAVEGGAGWVDRFILPGYEFRIIDGLLTNFHLPQSTLLMLVCAFAGRDTILAAYREAVRLRYRFYSYGDACLVV